MAKNKMKEGDPLVDLNAATVAEIARIPDIGPKSAAMVVAARPGGGFESWGHLRKLVSGWGLATISWVQPYATIGPLTSETPTEPEEPEEVPKEPAPEEGPQETPQAQGKPKPKQRRSTRAA